MGLDSHGLRAPLSRFLEGALYKYPEWMNEYPVRLSGLPGRRALLPLLLQSACYWCLVLKLQLGSVAHSPLLVPPPGVDSPWKSVSCLKIIKVRFAGCLRLICIAVVGLGAPLSRFLEGAPYKFLNEWLNIIGPYMNVRRHAFIMSKHGCIYQAYIVK